MLLRYTVILNLEGNISIERKQVKELVRIWYYHYMTLVIIPLSEKEIPGKNGIVTAFSLLYHKTSKNFGHMNVN